MSSTAPIAPFVFRRPAHTSLAIDLGRAQSCLDEEDSAVDPVIRDEVLARVRARMSRGILVLITHDPEVAQIADVVLKVEAGRATVSTDPAA